MKTIIYSRIASREFSETVDWYERERPGLGDRFTESVERIVEAIQAKPNRYPFIDEPFREAAMMDFPYVVIYEVRKRFIKVVAVYHTNRDPDGWKSRALSTSYSRP